MHSTVTTFIAFPRVWPRPLSCSRPSQALRSRILGGRRRLRSSRLVVGEQLPVLFVAAEAGQVVEKLRVERRQLFRSQRRPEKPTAARQVRASASSLNRCAGPAPHPAATCRTPRPRASRSSRQSATMSMSSSATASVSPPERGPPDPITTATIAANARPPAGAQIQRRRVAPCFTSSSARLRAWVSFDRVCASSRSTLSSNSVRALRSRSSCSGWSAHHATPSCSRSVCTARE